jgi:hypothetical protein
VLAADSATVRLDMDNEPQPDVLLMIDPAKGGQAKVSPDDYVEGAPELVGEVASSSANIDLHAKLNAYRRNGVREYVVWVVGERDVRWFVLAEGRYDRLPPDADGLLRSRAFPGLWLDPAALVGGDMTRVLDAARQGRRRPSTPRSSRRSLSGDAARSQHTRASRTTPHRAHPRRGVPQFLPSPTTTHRLLT